MNNSQTNQENQVESEIPKLTIMLAEPVKSSTNKTVSSYALDKGLRREIAKLRKIHKARSINEVLTVAVMLLKNLENEEVAKLINKHRYNLEMR